MNILRSNKLLWFCFLALAIFQSCAPSKKTSRKETVIVSPTLPIITDLNECFICINVTKICSDVNLALVANWSAGTKNQTPKMLKTIPNLEKVFSDSIAAVVKRKIKIKCPENKLVKIQFMYHCNRKSTYFS